MKVLPKPYPGSSFLVPGGLQAIARLYVLIVPSEKPAVSPLCLGDPSHTWPLSLCSPHPKCLKLLALSFFFFPQLEVSSPFWNLAAATSLLQFLANTC